MVEPSECEVAIIGAGACGGPVAPAIWRMASGLSCSTRNTVPATIPRAACPPSSSTTPASDHSRHDPPCRRPASVELSVEDLAHFNQIGAEAQDVKNRSSRDGSA